VRTDYMQAVKEWARIGSFIFIYILAGLTIKREKDIAGFTRVLLLSMLAPLALGAYQFVFHTGFVANLLSPERYNRIMGTYGNPVEFALALTFPLLLCVTIALDRNTRPERRVFFASCAAVLASFLFFTYTRSAWFGVTAGIMVIGLKRNKSVLVAVPLLVLLVLLVAPLESLRLGEFATGRLALSGRIGSWAYLLPLVKDHPFLGHGLTNLTAATQSDHVRLLLETGFFGWIAFLCLIGALLKALRKAYVSSQPGIERNFVLACLAFVVCTIIIGFSETNAMFQYYVWVPAGIALSKSMQRPGKRLRARAAFTVADKESPCRIESASSSTIPDNGRPVVR
jgi:O-antigen ligase